MRFFRVGDRVRVKTRRFGDAQWGQVGTVDFVHGEGESCELHVGVKFDPHQHDRHNSYAHSDLEALTPVRPGSVEAYILRELGS